MCYAWWSSIASVHTVVCGLRCGLHGKSNRGTCPAGAHADGFLSEFSDHNWGGRTQPHSVGWVVGGEEAALAVTDEHADGRGNGGGDGRWVGDGLRAR